MTSTKEGATNGPLRQLLQTSDIPRERWAKAEAEIARTLKFHAAPATRPLWDERHNDPQSAALSAPLFLKRVWVGLIDADGSIVTEDVRRTDASLMEKVGIYINNRKNRNRLEDGSVDLGDADGLTLLSRTGGGRRRSDNASTSLPPLHQHFQSKGIPAALWSELSAELDIVTAQKVKAAMRPKWVERGKYADLADLSSPDFLKHVYAEEIAADGTIKKDTVRAIDPKLMAAVETYISGREGRRLDMGDATGLRLTIGSHRRPKRAALES